MWARGVVLALLASGCDLVFGLKHELVPDAPGPLPPTRWTSVSAGEFHTCGIRLDQTLWCWGRNDAGQLGTGSAVTEVDTPIQVGTDLWSVVAAAGQHTCGVTTMGVLACWGDNGVGQLGNGMQSDKPTPTPTPIATVTPMTWRTVSTGPSHTCAIDTNGNASCWGFDDLGQLGDGMPMQIQPSPTPVPATTTWTAVVAGDTYTCAIAANKTRWCWGDNANGELGDGMFEVSILAPTQMDSDLWTSLSAREVTTCGIRLDGTLRCWGYNDHGQVGNDATDTEPLPTALANDTSTWTAVATGLAHSCGIAANGMLSCWGNNDHGQLAVATTDAFRTAPDAVAGGPWLALALGSQHTCAIDTDHRLWCAGQDGGQLGTADGGSRLRPIDIGLASAVAVGGENSCLVDPQGMLRCWGANANGTVGDGTRDDRESPVQTLVPAGVITAAAVGDHACAIDTTGGIGHLFCWGLNNNLQVSNNGMFLQLTPIEITPPDPNAPSWNAIAAAGHSCGIDSNGHSSCWGLNTNDQAGLDFAAFPTVPTPMIAGATTFSALAAGSFHTCGISIEGVLCWGDAAFGQLGDNGMVAQRVAGPAAMLPAGTATWITAGGLHSCAVVGTDGYCWGDNSNGEIGDQTTDGRGLPTLLDGAWVQLSAGLTYTCGIHTDHSLACWGSNAFGELGDGTRLEHHEPVAVNADVDWIFVATADSHTCALKQNGHLFCWGRNLEGEVGDGAAWRTTLVEVP